jgi:hypothetical protein
VIALCRGQPDSGFEVENPQLDGLELVLGHLHELLQRLLERFGSPG